MYLHHQKIYVQLITKFEASI